MPRIAQTQRQVFPTGQTNSTELSPGTFSAQTRAQYGNAEAINNINDVVMQIRNADMVKEQNEFAGYFNEQKRLQQQYMTETNDYSSYQSEWDKKIKDLSTRSASLKYSQTRKWAQNWMEQNKPLWQMEVDQYTRRAQVGEISASGMARIDQIVSQDDYAIEADATPVTDEKGQEISRGISERRYKENLINELVEKNVSTGIWSAEKGEYLRQKAFNDMDRLEIAAQKEAVKAQEEAQKAQVETAIEGIKPAIVESLGEDMSNKKAAIDTIEKALNDLKQKGIIDNVQAAEGLRKLNNYMKDVAQEYQTAQKQNIVQTYEQFADKLAAGKFTGDDIALSNLNETQKKEWEPVLEGKRQPPPVKSSYDGVNLVTNVMIDYAKGEIGKGETIGKLVNERYVNKSLTDDDFRFVLEKIKNPYPKHIAETVKGILESSENFYYHEGIGFLGKDWISRSEKDTLVRKTAAFLGWLESEAKDGKYPDGKIMYEKMREMGVTIKTPDVLPRPPERIIPKRTDPTFITTDEDYDKLDSGTMFYDGIMGVWRVKP